MNQKKPDIEGDIRRLKRQVLFLWVMNVLTVILFVWVSIRFAQINELISLLTGRIDLLDKAASLTGEGNSVLLDILKEIVRQLQFCFA